MQGSPVAGFPPEASAHAQSHLDQTAAQVVDRALTWLGAGERASSPWFAFVHLWDVHYDYLPAAPYDRYFDSGYAGEIDGHDFLSNPRIHAEMAPEDLEEARRLYDREIRALDAEIERLLGPLEGREGTRSVLIALVSDHGDQFFEHGHKGHTRTLFEEVVSIPIILTAPGSATSGTRVKAPVSLEDVAPTLLGLAGLGAMREATGRDLSALIRGESLPERPALLTFPPSAALRGEDWKLIADWRSGALRYYDLRRDPREAMAIEAPPDRVAQLQQRLRADRAHAEAIEWSGDDSVELDAETAERLRELGYGE